MVTATSVTDELRHRITVLRAASDVIHGGQLFSKVRGLAQAPGTWTGDVQAIFLGWLQNFEGWVRIRLGDPLDTLVDRIEHHVRDLENQATAQAYSAGAAPPVQPPQPIGSVPGLPPEYGMRLPHPPKVVSMMMPDQMRILAKALNEAKDTALTLQRTIRDNLAPVTEPPPAPGAPKVVHFPPDANDAVGEPKAYMAVADQLTRALQDVLTRAEAIERASADTDALPPMPSIDLSGAVSGAAASAQQEAGSVPAPVNPEVPPEVAPPTDIPPVTTESPPDAAPATEGPAHSPDPVKSTQEADALVDRYPPDQVLNDPAKLKELAQALKDHQPPNDPDFAVQFVNRFGAKNVAAVPRTLQAWQNRRDRSQRVTPPERNLDYNKLDKPRSSKEDIEGILYSFSATLATSTTSGSLSKEAEDEVIAADPVALSWLLSDHDASFSVEFLTKAFDRCVKDAIIAEHAARARVGGGPTTGGGPLALTGWNLYNDPKVATLNAISRNLEASKLIATRTFDPPVELPQYAGEPKVVTNVMDLLANETSYDDHGACLGRMLDTAHALLSSSDPAAAKALADQIIGHASNRDGVKRMKETFRSIGQRQAVTPEESQRALDEVRRNPKSPAAELYISMARLKDTAASFVADAAAGQKYADEVLRHTQAAWDLVTNGLKDPATSKNAEDALERTMKYIGDGHHLSDEARRGMALTLTQRLDALAIAAKKEDTPGRDAKQVGFHPSSDALKDSLKEIAKDDVALNTFVEGMGAWSSATYSGMAARFDEHIVSGEKWETAINDLGVDLNASLESIGQMFCATTTALKQEGLDRIAHAQKILSRYQFGVNLAFDVVPGLRSLDALKLADPRIPGTISGAVNDKIGSTIEDAKTGIAKGLSGADPDAEKLTNKQREAQLSRQLNGMMIESVMNGFAGRPGLLSHGHMELPLFMLKEKPDFYDQPRSAWPPDYPTAYLKPEFVGPPNGTPDFPDSHAVRFPVRGEPSYDDFADWYEVDHPLANAAREVTQDVVQKMDHCLLANLH